MSKPEQNTLLPGEDMPEGWLVAGNYPHDRRRVHFRAGNLPVCDVSHFADCNVHIRPSCGICHLCGRSSSILLWGRI